MILVPLIFHVSTTYAIYEFGILAIKWPKLMQYWESVEIKLAKGRVVKEKHHLAKGITLTTFAVMFASLSKRKCLVVISNSMFKS